MECNKTIDYTKPSGGGGGGGEPELFTGSASIDVGGVKAGDSWTNAPLSVVVNDIINPELNPVLTAPSFTFTSNNTGLKEIGSSLNISLTATFNRGSITPQYTATEPYRSGLPSRYIFTGPASEEISSTQLAVTKTISNHIVTIGDTIFGCSVVHSEGVQPKTSKGNDFNTPLSAGTLSPKTVTIKGVYPTYSGIDTLTKNSLQTHGSAIIVNAPSDMNTAGERFKIEYPSVWSGNTPVIQQENELSGSWDNQDMSEFVITTIDKSGVSYKQVKYIGSAIGARKLKLVF